MTRATIAMALSAILERRVRFNGDINEPMPSETIPIGRQWRIVTHEPAVGRVAIEKRCRWWAILHYFERTQDGSSRLVRRLGRKT